jgi:F-type H+-transporting ATPase subunit b
MMTTRRKIASILAMPAAFVGAFVLAFLAASLLWGVADAFAQPAETPTPTETETGERPPYGYAPPSDDMDNDAVDADANAPHGGEVDVAPHGAAHPDGVVDGAKAADHGGHHGDPTENWNWLGLHYGKDIAGGKLGDGVNLDPKTGKTVAGPEEPMSAPFVLMIVNFAILMLILVWKGKPAAQKLAAERHDQIKTALDEAAKLRTQAQDKLAEYETKLKDADSEIKKLVEGIRTDAEADKARILANAEKQSAIMKHDAELRIAAEIEIARAMLTREVTAAASVATEKLLRAAMVPADQHKLVSSFITDLQPGKTDPASAKERM